MNKQKTLCCGLLLFVLLTTLPLQADWKEEELKINYLLEAVGRVEGVFIRNGTEYSPAQAVEHLKMKMATAVNSWFSPAKEKWTVEMFIDELASKSSLSGIPYQIKFNDGRIVSSGEWLYQQLKNYQKPS